jgi:hypothetical protein
LEAIQCFYQANEHSDFLLAAIEMEELAVATFQDLDNQSSTYFTTGAQADKYVMRLARNFTETKMERPEGTTDDSMSSLID